MIPVRTRRKDAVPGKRPDHVIITNEAAKQTIFSNNAYTALNLVSCFLRVCTEIERVAIQRDTIVKLSVYTYCPAFLRVDYSLTNFKLIVVKKKDAVRTYQVLYTWYVQCSSYICKHTWKASGNTVPSHYLHHRLVFIFACVAPFH